MKRYERVTDDAWARERVGTLPARWQRRILGRWEKRRRQHGAQDFAEQAAQAEANRELLGITAELQGAALPLDAEDFHVIQHAQRMADMCMGRGQLWGAQLNMGADAVRASMAKICEANGVDAPAGKGVTDKGAIARMTCAIWWRRQLRRQHAKSVEAAAIALGYVNKSEGLYVSDETLMRRIQQNARNAAALENTIAVNEDGEGFTLAELAAKGTANKAVRRAELMTRISGFERIARDLGHAGLFMTVTCPSRMHRWRTVAGGRVIDNPRYDGTTPAQANKYLGQVWARVRAQLGRAGLPVYGFRIAEPQHDGTPHWHFLIFHEAARLDELRAVVWRYALADSPDERGAHAHRCDFKPIDWTRGSAAGYIAKYIAKNIDGYKVGQDLFGNDAMETSARVEAWASTWGIRQFQQVGGPPVGPWRELRRVQQVPDGAPDHLKAAHNAVNKTAVIEGRENASVAWDHYVKAQGGVFCGRDYRIKVSLMDQDGRGRYGDPLPAKPVGVETLAREVYTPAHMAHMGGKASRLVLWLVESVRRTWEVMTRAAYEARRKLAGVGVSDGTGAKPLAPWTCVNNCTGAGGKNGLGYPDGREKTARGDQNGARNLGQSPGACSDHGGGIR